MWFQLHIQCGDAWVPLADVFCKGDAATLQELNRSVASDYRWQPIK